MSTFNLEGNKVALVIAQDQFRDEELFEPKEYLEANGAKTVIASTSLDEATGMLGGKAKPESLLDNLDHKDFSAVIVVGGMGSPEFLWNNEKLHKLLQDMNAANKIVAGICLSGAVLANAGVLKGKKATVWETEESKASLEKGGAEFIGEPTVKDGKVITANGPEAAKDFAQLIAKELSTVKV